MSIKWSDTARAAWGISSIIQTFPSCGWLVWLRYSPFSPGPIVTFVWRDQQGNSWAILGGGGQVHAAVTQVLSWAAVAACWNHSPLIPKNFHKPCLMFWFLSLLGKCKEFVVCLLEGFQNWAQNPLPALKRAVWNELRAASAWCKAQHGLFSHLCWASSSESGWIRVSAKYLLSFIARWCHYSLCCWDVQASFTAMGLNPLWCNLSSLVMHQEGIRPGCSFLAHLSMFTSLCQKDGVWKLLLLSEKEVCNATCLLGCVNSILQRKNILF